MEIDFEELKKEFNYKYCNSFTKSVIADDKKSVYDVLEDVVIQYKNKIDYYSDQKMIPKDFWKDDSNTKEVFHTINNFYYLVMNFSAYSWFVNKPINVLPCLIQHITRGVGWERYVSLSRIIQSLNKWTKYQEDTRYKCNHYRFFDDRHKHLITDNDTIALTMYDNPFTHKILLRILNETSMSKFISQFHNLSFEDIKAKVNYPGSKAPGLPN